MQCLPRCFWLLCYSTPRRGIGFFVRLLFTGWGKTIKIRGKERREYKKETEKQRGRYEPTSRYRLGDGFWVAVVSGFRQAW